MWDLLKSTWTRVLKINLVCDVHSVWQGGLVESSNCYEFDDGTLDHLLWFNSELKNLVDKCQT